MKYNYKNHKLLSCSQKLKSILSREVLLREVIEKIRSSLDPNEIRKELVTQIGSYFKADRTFIILYDPNEDKYFPVDKDSEYLSGSEQKSVIGLDCNEEYTRYYIDKNKANQEIIFSDLEKYILENNLENTLAAAYMRNYDVKSNVGFPMFYKGIHLGELILHYTKNPIVFKKNDFDFLRIIVKQTSIALYQADLYKKLQQTAKMEILLRKNLEVIRSSLDIDDTKLKIVTEVGKSLKADVCVIVNYDKEKNKFFIDEYSEFRLSENTASLVNIDFTQPEYEFFIAQFKQRNELVFSKIENFLRGYNLESTLTEDLLKYTKTKSYMGMPIVYADELLGYFLINYSSSYVNIEDNYLKLARLLADQAAVAMHQATLYKLTKLQAEREKIERNIIEILRSTLDKDSIKHLFVEYIGKYFNADIVFFSEYDKKTNMFMPVDKSAEYLSRVSEKSFVGNDWSDSSIKEYIQPLLEKRELKIYCWDDYIKENQKSENFIDLFINANIKSSYNLPVLYQENLIGYFCIDFTREVNTLSNEDITRIRNICTQAGIALYHSSLFIEAKKSLQAKSEFIANIYLELKEHLVNISECSEIFTIPDADQQKKLDCIDDIGKRGINLLEIIDEITYISQIESEHFKLTYEYINLKQLISDITSSIKLNVESKNIQIDFYTDDSSVKVDKIGMSQIVYGILNAAINIMPENGHIVLKSHIDNYKLIILVEFLGEFLHNESLDMIFEKFKQIDSFYEHERKNIGLSLSIVRKMTELHNGIIQVDSLEDRGTVIKITIPNVLLS